MNTPPLENNEGTFGGVFQLPWPFPTLSTIECFNKQFKQGSLVLKLEPSARMRLVLCIGQHKLEVLSCPLEMTGSSVAIIFIRWNVSQGLLDLRVNSQTVASTNPGASIPERLTLKLGVGSNDGRKDFSGESDGARKKRHGTPSGTHPVRGRERADDLYIFKGLENGLLQSKDLLAHIQRGATHHAAGLAVLVRTMIADNKSKTGGLVQWCAAMLDAPLIIFTCADPISPITQVIIPDDHIEFNGSSVPDAVNDNPVDLDVWLEFHGATVGGKSFTNKEALHKIGSTIGGHFDVDRHPLVGSLSSLSLGEIQQDFLVAFIEQGALLATALAEKLLVQRASVDSAR